MKRKQKRKKKLKMKTRTNEDELYIWSAVVCILLIKYSNKLKYSFSVWLFVYYFIMFVSCEKKIKPLEIHEQETRIENEAKVKKDIVFVIKENKA
jgi:hypothetical protein